LRRNGEWLNSLYCLLHVFGARISFDDFIIGCERENMLLEMSHYNLFDTVIFFNRQILTIIKISIYALTIIQASVLFSILEEIAWVQYFFWIPQLIDRLKSIVVLSLFLFKFKHQYVALFFLFTHLILHLIQFSLTVLEFKTQSIDLMLTSFIIHLFCIFQLLELLVQLLIVLLWKNRLNFLLWFNLDFALSCWGWSFGRFPF
jgi:hypothetical protein